MSNLVVGQSFTATCTVTPDVAQMFAFVYLKKGNGGPQIALSVTKLSAGPPAVYSASYVPTTDGTWVVRFADSLTPPVTGGFVEEQAFVVYPLDY